MKQTWRWFGPSDVIPLSDLHQVGVEGIVSALHHIPTGEIWSKAEIEQRQSLLAKDGYTWDVVESLPVSEAIKMQNADANAHIAAYKVSLRHLAQAGLKTICYNFMPVLDWTRTDLRAPQPHGGTAMGFDLVEFALFDIYLLKRENAAEDYDQVTAEAAARLETEFTDQKKTRLIQNITAGLPGANDTWGLDDVRDLLASYAAISPDKLRQNLVDFLGEIIPDAEALGLRLCCHPDDPPFGLLGLPRVMSSTQDYEFTMTAVDSPANGATLCTGSLGVRADFDGADFVARLGSKIHFVHLRNTKRLPSADPHRPSFFEAAHLEGDTDLVATIRALIAEEKNRKAQGRSDWNIPMRPDHGQELLSDLGGHSMPGYPLIGRMRGLAELRGIMAAIEADL